VPYFNQQTALEKRKNQSKSEGVDIALFGKISECKIDLKLSG